MDRRSSFKVMLLAPIAPPVGGIATWTRQVLDYYENTRSTRTYVLEHYNTAIISKRITELNLFSRLIAGVKDFVYHYGQIKKKFYYVRPDVVHMTSSGSLGLFKDYFLLRFFRGRKVKTIVHFRFGRITELSKSKSLEWRLLLEVVKLADDVIVLDSQSLATLSSSGFTNVALIPNPISDAKIDLFDNNSLRVPGSILFVGHVIQMKGVFDLVAAFKKLPIDSSLWIVGPYEEKVMLKLKELAGEDSLRIVFGGALASFAVLEKMRMCSVFVLPSYTEGFPNVLLEAMSQGCAIVSTRVGAIEDVLSDSSGIVLEPGDISALATNLSNLLSDDSLNRKLGANARAKVIDNYTLDKIILSLEKLWIKYR